MTATATEIRPHCGPQEQFLSCPADIAIYGGAAGGGKTWAILMEPLRHVHVPEFKAVIFRRTYPEITNAGGLWDESWSLYPLLGAEARLTDLQWSFPSGARIEFGHLQHESDKSKWQGAQITLIAFDELTHFTESQFFYMLSRNRSTSGVRPYVRATCNPDADSWVAGFVAWWIDQETGYADPDRAGKVRWFVRVHGSIEWGDSPDELRERFPDQAPKSVAFIPARLEDNPTLMEADPSYRANLQALPLVEQERLLGGNWKIHATEGSEWADHPEYFGDHIWAEDDQWPGAFELSAIAIDPSKGASERSDYSAIVFGGWAGGVFWLDADIKRRPSEQIVDDGIDMFLRLGASSVPIESNMSQHLFRNLFDATCDRRGLLPMPVRDVEHHEPKVVRIRRLGPHLRARRIRIRRNEGGQQLFNQLRKFGIKGVNDDGPDAAEMVIEELFWLSRNAVALPDQEYVYT